MAARAEWSIYDETTLLIIMSILKISESGITFSLFSSLLFFEKTMEQLKESEIADFASKLNIQPEVIIEVRKVFEIFDEDCDGKITTKELGGLCSYPQHGF